jgi:hypothetical protein
MAKETRKPSGCYNDVATKCAVGYFYGCVPHDEFVKVANSLLEIIEKNKYSKQINDVSEMNILSSDTNIYLKKEWFPRAKKLGLKHFAFVISKNDYGKLSTEKANNGASQEFDMNIQYFDSMAAARMWLNKI